MPLSYVFYSEAFFLCQCYNVPLFNVYLCDLSPRFKYAKMDLKFNLVNLCIHLLNDFAEDSLKIRKIFSTDFIQFPRFTDHE